MIKVLWFLARLGLVCAALVFLVKHPGHIQIVWQGYLIETSMAVLLGAGAVFLLLWTYGVRAWRGIVDTPKVYRRYQASMAREKGYRAVTQGLVAIAAGDARAAEKLSLRAQNLVPDAPLTKLLIAQSAQLNGDAPAARRAFAQLLDDESAAFFGVRGLLNDALRAGDYQGALGHARTAEELQPKRQWIVRTLFDLETRNRDWQKAEKTLKKAEKIGLFDAVTARSHRQALYLAQAIDDQAQDRPAQAFRGAERAFHLDAAFTPAAAMLAEIYDANARRSKAVSTVEAAWQKNPHPALAALWMRLAPPEKKTKSIYDAGRGLYDWAKRLYDLNPANKESARALGLAALQGRQWREARQYLEQAGDYRALAQLEQEETGSDAQARKWLEKAADAMQDARWCCSSCGRAAVAWVPLCPQCRSFNRIVWMTGHDAAPHPLLTAEAFSPSDIIAPPEYGTAAG